MAELRTISYTLHAPISRSHIWIFLDICICIRHDLELEIDQKWSERAKGSKIWRRQHLCTPYPLSTKTKTDDDRLSLTLTPVMLGVVWVILESWTYKKQSHKFLEARQTTDSFGEK